MLPDSLQTFVELSISPEVSGTMLPWFNLNGSTVRCG